VSDPDVQREFKGDMTPSAEPQNADFSVSELVRELLAFGNAVWLERRRVWRALAVTIPVGLVFAFGCPEEYTASTELLPYRSGPITGGLSDLASLAGVRFPTSVNDQTITADLYPVIAKTLDFQLSVAETPLRFARSNERVSMVRYLREHRSVLGAAKSWVSGLRYTLGSVLSRAPRPGTALVTDSGGSLLRAYDREYLKLVRQLDERLIVRFDRKTSIISVTGVMPDPYAAADLVQTASELLMQRIIDYEARKAAEQLQFIEGQYRQSRTRYDEAQRSLAVFEDRNRMLVSAVAQIERERLQREKDVAYQVVQQLTTELEQARIKEHQDTPVFTVLEHVTVPNEHSSPRRSAILLLAAFLGVAFAATRILWVRLIVQPERRPGGPEGLPESAQR
jgi:uncharacterized protein involved in exopolysaccharide biosynthesis